MMILNNLGLNPGPLVCNPLVIFFNLLKIPLMLFLRLKYHTNRSQIQMGLTRFNIFTLALKFGIFVPNLKFSIIVFLSIVSHCISNRCYLPYRILMLYPMGDIWCPYDSGSGDQDPRVFIQFVNGRKPMAHKFWSHGLDVLSHGVHPKARE